MPLSAPRSCLQSLPFLFCLQSQQWRILPPPSPLPRPKEMFLTSFASPPVGSSDEVGPTEDNLPYIKVRCFGTFLVHSPFSATEGRVNTWKKVCRHRRWKSSGHCRLLPPSCRPLGVVPVCTPTSSIQVCPFLPFPSPCFHWLLNLSYL